MPSTSSRCCGRAAGRAAVDEVAAQGGGQVVGPLGGPGQQVEPGREIVDAVDEERQLGAGGPGQGVEGEVVRGPTAGRGEGRVHFAQVRRCTN